MILTLTSLLVIRFPNNCYSIVLTLVLFDFKNKIIIIGVHSRSYDFCHF